MPLSAAASVGLRLIGFFPGASDGFYAGDCPGAVWVYTEKTDEGQIPVFRSCLSSQEFRAGGDPGERDGNTDRHAPQDGVQN
jgi:hypothetical protein